MLTGVIGLSVNDLELDQAGSLLLGMEEGGGVHGREPLPVEIFKPTGKTALMATMACFSGR